MKAKISICAICLLMFLNMAYGCVMDYFYLLGYGLQFDISSYLKVIFAIVFLGCFLKTDCLLISYFLPKLTMIQIVLLFLWFQMNIDWVFSEFLYSNPLLGYLSNLVYFAIIAVLGKINLSHEQNNHNFEIKENSDLMLGAVNTIINTLVVFIICVVSFNALFLTISNNVSPVSYFSHFIIVTLMVAVLFYSKFKKFTFVFWGVKNNNQIASRFIALIFVIYFAIIYERYALNLNPNKIDLGIGILILIVSIVYFEIKISFKELNFSYVAITSLLFYTSIGLFNFIFLTWLDTFEITKVLYKYHLVFLVIMCLLFLFFNKRIAKLLTCTKTI